uniref:Uncharacterized protein n=1 Tax=Romanomermis culicivorax TaxID=13658 RepID=A0A915IQ44_ROMCU
MESNTYFAQILKLSFLRGQIPIGTFKHIKPQPQVDLRLKAIFLHGPISPSMARTVVFSSLSRSTTLPNDKQMPNHENIFKSTTSQQNVSIFEQKYIQ